MRRLAITAITTGALITGLAATTTPAMADTKPLPVLEQVAEQAPTGVSAKKATNFTLYKSGLKATQAWGSYWWGKKNNRTVRYVKIYVKDLKKGRQSCVHVRVLPGKGQKARHEGIVFNHRGKGTTTKNTVYSPNRGRIYMRECEGYNTKRGFKITAAGSWRWFS
ncbi:hypothetical protein ACSNOI_05205 [Actinomadura kijaniata]|uniref:hypothetical protein n=1 Tax=Actinomadura kijaniata TaxID=46161 RepID=UPI003F1B4C05